MLTKEWREIIEKIDFAFQPIVNINSGTTFAFEALLRNQEMAGFSTIDSLFDAAYAQQILHDVDLGLRKKAIEKFAKAGLFRFAKLFYNLDNRIVSVHDYKPGKTYEILREFDLAPFQICFEISERHDLPQIELKQIIGYYKEQGYGIAVDDFGTGFSGLKLLYLSEPNFIKIDRFFISEISRDFKKRLFVANIVNIAHTLGISVIAEGVESEKEYSVCKEIGCNLVQGFFIQKPTTDMRALCFSYDHIGLLGLSDRRRNPSQDLLKKSLEYIDPIKVYEEIADVLERFRKNKKTELFPRA